MANGAALRANRRSVHTKQPFTLCKGLGFQGSLSKITMNYNLLTRAAENRWLASIVACAAVLGGIRAGAEPSHRPAVSPTGPAQVRKLPHGAFVIEPVHNAAELSRHLDRHPQVAQRYARLTNMTPRMVKMAFSHLHVMRLASDTSLEIYYCHTNEAGDTIGFRRRRVPRGTTVFAFADGTPAIIQACGKPTRALESAGREIRVATADAAVKKVMTEAADSAPDSLPELSMGASEYFAFDDFQETPAPELYVPRQPELPAPKLSTYSADNLYEWARHKSRSRGASAVTISLAGAAGLGFALSGNSAGNLAQALITPVIDFARPTGADVALLDAAGLGSAGGSSGNGVAAGTPGSATFPGNPGSTGLNTPTGLGGTTGFKNVVPEPAAAATALACALSYVGLYLNRRVRCRPEAC